MPSVAPHSGHFRAVVMSDSFLSVGVVPDGSTFERRGGRGALVVGSKGKRELAGGLGGGLRLGGRFAGCLGLFGVGVA